MKNGLIFTTPTAETSNILDAGTIFKRRQRLATTKAQMRDVARIKKLIWVYFWLLIFEGVLRKWVVPTLSNPLLLIRDPIVLMIYFLAWRANLFPRNIFLITLGVIAFVSGIAGIIVLQDTVFTAFYGFRANFLHLPLIFLMRRVLNFEDVKRFGFWVLMISIPMALLMTLQFLAPPLSIINSGLSGDFEQITGNGGHIRPPGTFSFITGPIYFFGLVSAYILNAQFTRGEDRHSLTLIALSTTSLLLAMSISISRSLVVNVGLVFLAGFLAAFFLQPRYISRWILGIGLIILVSFAIPDVGIVQEGFSLLLNRSEGAATGGAVGSDMVVRVVGEFTKPFDVFFETPLLGHGLGLGTNGGASLAGEGAYFISQEGEWSRNLLESGPLLGGVFIIWRICFTIYLGRLALSSAMHGNILPLLIFAVCGVLILYGMFPQPTALGFTAFLSGLCCAAMKVPTHRVTPTFET